MLEFIGKCCGGIEAIEFMESLADVIDEDEKTEEFCEKYQAALNRFRYEVAKDLEEQGKLLKLPVAIGDIVYTNCSVSGWYFMKKRKPYAAKVVFIGINGTENYMNVDFGCGNMLQFKFQDIGKLIFLTKEEAAGASGADRIGGGRG